MKYLTNGAVAKLFGIPKFTLRHYINKQILTPQQYQNKYYLFGEADLYRLYQILFFRRIGYSVNQI